VWQEGGAHTLLAILACAHGIPAFFLSLPLLFGKHTHTTNAAGESINQCCTTASDAAIFVAVVERRWLCSASGWLTGGHKGYYTKKGGLGAPHGTRTLKCSWAFLGPEKIERGRLETSNDQPHPIPSPRHQIFLSEIGEISRFFGQNALPYLYYTNLSEAVNFMKQAADSKMKRSEQRGARPFRHQSPSALFLL